MRNSIYLSAFRCSIRGSVRWAATMMLAVGAWGGDTLKLADGLIVDYTLGAPLPGVVTANVVSNLGAVPYTVTVTSGGWLAVSPLSGTTPAVIGITVNPSGLGVGTYQGSLTVKTTVQLNGKTLDASDTSPVTLQIGPGTPSAVTVAPGTLSFDGTVGQTLAGQAIKVSSTPGSVNFTVEPMAGWLSVNPASGITNGAPGQSVDVFVNTAGLAAGDYSSSLNVATPGATPSTHSVAVLLKLRPGVNLLTMAPPPGLSFTGVTGGAVPVAQSFGLEAGSKNLSFEVRTNAAWLTATPAAGRTPGVVGVQVNPAGLAEGTYQGMVVTRVAEATPAVYQTVVTLVLNKAPAPLPLPLTATPMSMSFAGTVGGTNPSAALLTVTDPSGPVGATVAVAVDAGWLKVTPANGGVPLGVQVEAVTAGLTAGQRTGKVTLTRTDVNPNLVTTVPVTLSMVAGPTIAISPSSVSLKGRAGETGGGSQVSLTLTTASAAPVAYELTLTSAGGWLMAAGGCFDGTGLRGESGGDYVDGRCEGAGGGDL